MESRVNYTLVGFFVVILGLAVIAMAFWMTADRTTKKFDTYLVYMNEPVSGLSVQGAVKYNGVDVGYVESIRLNHDNPQQVILKLAIQQGTPITISTVATLRAQGVTGITYVGLSAKTSTSLLLVPKPGEQYPVIPSEPSFLVQLDTALRELTTNITNISGDFRKVFNDENAMAISKTLKNIDTFTTMLADKSKDLGETISDARVVFTNTKKASVDFPRLTRNLAKMGSDVSQASKQVTLTMRTSRHALKSIGQQVVPPTLRVLRKLDMLSSDLSSLSKELQRNPSMLIRGRVPRVAGPGER